MYLPSSKAAQQLGCHPNTLRKWANKGKIPYIKTESGPRRYHVEALIGKLTTPMTVGYCRVSSPKRRDDLERPIEFMREKYPQAEIIQDLLLPEWTKACPFQIKGRAIKEAVNALCLLKPKASRRFAVVKIPSSPALFPKQRANRAVSIPKFPVKVYVMVSLYLSLSWIPVWFGKPVNTTGWCF